MEKTDFGTTGLRLIDLEANAALRTVVALADFSSMTHLTYFESFSADKIRSLKWVVRYIL